MAWYKRPKDVSKVEDPGPHWDELHYSGDEAPYAGIYQCQGCGKEIGIAKGHTFPPQSKHEHRSSDGAIRWRLSVRANHNVWKRD